MRVRGRVHVCVLLLHFLYFLFYVHAFAEPCVTSGFQGFYFVLTWGSLTV